MTTPARPSPSDPAQPSDAGQPTDATRPSLAKLWVEGARLRTLPLAIAPVLLGTGAAAVSGGVAWGAAALCLALALALQIGVNYANDYSDGVRGTDEVRVGPVRLTASGRVPAARVRAVAFGFLGLGGVIGLVLVAMSGHWWLLAVGAAAILAAWWYTGGKHPYGYAGLGEVAVFVFFGLVATLGTQYLQAGVVSGLGWLLAVAIGLWSCAVLMINNIRDLDQDAVVGKRTLAVRLGAVWARRAFVALLFVPYGLLVVAALVTPYVWAGMGLAALPVTVIAAMAGVKPKAPRDLITSLKLTSVGALAASAFTTVGLLLTALVAAG